MILEIIQIVIILFCWVPEIIFHKNGNDNMKDVMAISYFLFLGKVITES